MRRNQQDRRGSLFDNFKFRDSVTTPSPTGVISFGKNVRELPLHKIKDVTSENIAAYCSPPECLNEIHARKYKENENKKSHAIIKGVQSWKERQPFAYGIANSLYERDKDADKLIGDPLADSLAITARYNCAILALADGVSWGHKSKLASNCSIYGAITYINKHINRCRTTKDVFTVILHGFESAQNTIIDEEGTMTTLCVGVVVELQEKDRWGFCVVNVGDSYAYVYNAKKEIQEITHNSHPIDEIRDMRFCGGSLGPADGCNPDLANLTCSFVMLEKGDIVFLCSDGISDNFDPSVSKIMPKPKIRKVESKNTYPAKTQTFVDSSPKLISNSDQNEKEKFFLPLSKSKLPLEDNEKNEKYCDKQQKTLFTNYVDHDSARNSSNDDELEFEQGVEAQERQEVYITFKESNTIRTLCKENSIETDETVYNDNIENNVKKTITRSKSHDIISNNTKIYDNSDSAISNTSSLSADSNSGIDILESLKNKRIANTSFSSLNESLTNTTDERLLINQNGDLIYKKLHPTIDRLKGLSNENLPHIDHSKGLSNENLPHIDHSMNSPTKKLLNRSLSNIDRISINKSNFITSPLTLSNSLRNLVNENMFSALSASCPNLCKDKDEGIDVGELPALDRFYGTLDKMAEVISHQELEPIHGAKLKADDLCTRLLSFVFNNTKIRREILEEVSQTKLNKLSVKERKLHNEDLRKRLVGVPGKLDHASIVAFEVGYHDINENSPRDKTRDSPLEGKKFWFSKRRTSEPVTAYALAENRSKASILTR